MPTFQSKTFRPTSQSSSPAARYRAALAKHPFALFGLPFIATMVLGSFFLTPATALRYERFDKKVKQLSKEEELGIGKNKRKIDLRDEYYVCEPANRSCIGLADKRLTETSWERSRQLGAETCPTITGRARRSVLSMTLPQREA